MTRIHFLNVGRGDCTIIEHAGGNITMIDINNSDSLDNAIAGGLYALSKGPGVESVRARTPRPQKANAVCSCQTNPSASATIGEPS